MTCKKFDFCGNLRTCVKTRPPLVVFTAGLLIMGCAFIYVAFYVTSHGDIPNINLRDDWTDFLDDASKIKWCLGNTSLNSQADIITFPYHNYTVSVSLLVRVPKNYYLELKNLSRFKGVIAREKLIKKGGQNHAGESLLVLFDLPQVDASTIHKSTDVLIHSCLTFCGEKANSLPKFLTTADDQSGNVCVQGLTNRTVLLAKDGAENVAHLVIDNKQTVDMVLSWDDRHNINMHLLYTSYFLLFTAVSVLIYGLVKGRNSGSKQ